MDGNPRAGCLAGRFLLITNCKAAGGRCRAWQCSKRHSTNKERENFVRLDIKIRKMFAAVVVVVVVKV